MKTHVHLWYCYKLFAVLADTEPDVTGYLVCCMHKNVNCHNTVNFCLLYV